jgi:hypothetical protein
VTSGVADLRALVADAKAVRQQGGRTVAFIDELHRFNKAQQDALLPHVEEGTITLIGATTENPYIGDATERENSHRTGAPWQRDHRLGCTTRALRYSLRAREAMKAIATSAPRRRPTSTRSSA